VLKNVQPLSRLSWEVLLSMLIYMTGFCLKQEPQVYVKEILQVHKKYKSIVLRRFNNHAYFVEALDKVNQSYI
jgi:hypothetical protein